MGTQWYFYCKNAAIPILFCELLVKLYLGWLQVVFIAFHLLWIHDMDPASHEKIATDLLTSLKFNMSNLLKIDLRTWFGHMVKKRFSWYVGHSSQLVSWLVDVVGWAGWWGWHTCGRPIEAAAASLLPPAQWPPSARTLAQLAPPGGHHQHLVLLGQDHFVKVLTKSGKIGVVWVLGEVDAI